MKHHPGEGGDIARWAPLCWPESYSRTLTAEQLEMMLTHLDCVEREGSKYNLTAIHDRERARSLHIVDSLAGLPEVDQAPDGALLDLGAGAGYPGIPLAAVSGRETTLLDSVAKKTRFLTDAVGAIGLSDRVRVLNMRAEELARLDGGFAFSVVSARAVTSLSALIELSSPLLVQGGLLVAWKGPDSTELAAADRTADICGLAPFGARGYALPPGGERRVIHVYEKIAEPQTPLPRRVGMAQKRPLG